MTVELKTGVILYYQQDRIRPILDKCHVLSLAGAQLIGFWAQILQPFYFWCTAKGTLLAHKGINEGHSFMTLCARYRKGLLDSMIQCSTESSSLFLYQKCRLPPIVVPFMADIWFYSTDGAVATAPEVLGDNKPNSSRVAFILVASPTAANNEDNWDFGNVQQDPSSGP